MVLGIQHREINVTVLTTLLDHYFLLYLPFSLSRFCPVLYFSLLLSFPLFPHLTLFIPYMFRIIPFFYTISFAHAEEDYLQERKCCDEDILEKRGGALDWEEGRRSREKTSNSEKMGGKGRRRMDRTMRSL